MLFNSVIGIYGPQRKLLIVRQVPGGEFDFHCIDLNRVSRCSFTKCFRTVNIGGNGREKYERDVDKILLQIELLERAPVHLVFFDPFHSPISAMQESDDEAVQWEVLLSQLVINGTRDGDRKTK